MDWTTLLDSMQSTLGNNLPAILGALAILVLGWIVAVLIRAVLRRSLGFFKLNQHIESATGNKMDLESGIAKGVYYVVLLLVLIGFFNALDLPLVSAPLQSLVDQVFAYAPRLAAAGILILLAWVLAMVLRKVVTKTLSATRLDEKISAEAGMRPLSQNVGDVLYWLVILVFLPAILGALGLSGLLLPVQDMVDKILAMVPNIFAAVIIGLVGWFVARLLRDLVSNLLSATGVDGLGQSAGLRETMTLSRLIGLVVYVLVLVPALIAALDALQIEAISRPATDMLGAFMAAIPGIFGATVILAVAWFVANFVGSLVSELLSGVGMNEIPAKLGLRATLPAQASPAKIVGKLIVFFTMVFAIVEAANRLGFTQVAELAAAFIEFGASVLLGAVIILIGLWLSNLAAEAITGIGIKNAQFFAGLARYGILGLVLAMGLRAMGIADDIVNLAFALTLGAVAVAVALAFGLGGREAAGRQMEHWLSRLRGES
jgi:hypothetical protein